MNEAEDKLRRALDERVSRESLRTLSTSDGLVDFCSNDYLGFSRSQVLKDKIREETDRHGSEKTGSTGSRLISGNSAYFEDLEKEVADFHRAESGLIFNSGYDANLGVFSSIPQRNDTILYDRLVHASIRDGIRLSHASAFPFEHNDCHDLDRRLKTVSGTVYVAVESVYSMDGDCAPLTEMAELCRKSGANLVVDEAHATGVFGRKGEGKVGELGLEREVFARIHTFGKALGSHGAAVLGSNTLRSYLLNFARSFIYTTALPFHSLASIRCAYEYLAADENLILRLRDRISLFKESVGAGLASAMIPSESAIQCILIPGNSEVKRVAREIQRSGFDVRPIMHPTVPAGLERLRVCVHAFNTDEEIGELTNKLRTLMP
jgi:8-amino-7-oxononanoate synthase